MTLSLPIEPAATELLYASPLALLLAMMLDQQVTMEKAFGSPYVLRQRLGRDLDPAGLADGDPDELVALFSRPPALHRFPRAMAHRTQELARILVDRYGGDTAALWTGARTGTELLRRVAELPGFGTQKAQIFVALLGKQFGVTPRGWRTAAGIFGTRGGHRSVADVTDERSLAKVRAYKQEMKAAARAAVS